MTALPPRDFEILRPRVQVSPTLHSRQLEIVWVVPAGEERDRWRAELCNVKARARRGRVNHERARAALENTGARVLGEPDKGPATPMRKYVARVYYHSEGDELLCFDAPNLTYDTATAIASLHSNPVPQEWDAKRKRFKPQIVRVPSAEKFLATEIGPDAEAQDRAKVPTGGARLVKLPSQYYVQRELVAE